MIDEMGFQPISELSSTDRWRVQMKRMTGPDSWSCNMEASSAELCLGSRGEHVTMMGQTEVCLTEGIDHCGADVFEVCWTKAMDAVECSSRSLELNLLSHWQPVENIAQDW